MSDKSKIGLSGTSPGFGDDRATLILTDVVPRSAAKDGSIDVDLNA
jgi:hypothetical protein